MQPLQLTVAGIIFLIVSLTHLTRLTFRVKITIGTFKVPLWFSVIGFFVALFLALWMLGFKF